jgi:hypothetical protein
MIELALRRAPRRYQPELAEGDMTLNRPAPTLAAALRRFLLTGSAGTIA